MLLAFFPSMYSQVDVAFLRDLFIRATAEEEKARQLILETEREKNNALVMGYHGAGKMLMAKFYFNPFTKLSSFNKGKTLLEAAIESDADNPELRFLRMSIQQNAPAFLGYHDNISEDEKYITQILPGMEDVQLKAMIINYFQQN